MLLPGSASGGTEAWKLTWALHVDERPPPSSIVGQLETKETIGSHKLRIRNSYWSLWLLLLAVLVGKIRGGLLGWIL